MSHPWFQQMSMKRYELEQENKHDNGFD